MKPILTIFATATLVCLAVEQQVLAQYGDSVRRSGMFHIGDQDAEHHNGEPDGPDQLGQRNGVYRIGEPDAAQTADQNGVYRIGEHAPAFQNGGHQIGQRDNEYRADERAVLDHVGPWNAVYRIGDTDINESDLSEILGDDPLACTDDCDTCGADDCRCPTKLWVSFEYLLWLRKDRRLPVLATTSTPGVPLNTGAPNFMAIAGALGQSTTGILFGGNRVDDGFQSGGRVTIGRWMGDENLWGVGGRFFIVTQDEVEFSRASDALGRPTLARPFFNTDPGRTGQDALMVAFNGPFGAGTGPLFRGDINATTTNDVLGAEAYARLKLDCGQCYNLDLIGGYHFTRIDDDLRVVSNTTVLDRAGGPPGTVFGITDQFATRNDFNGAELGLLASFCEGPFTLTMMGKGSIGNMRQEVTINGSTTINGTLVRNAGLLAQSTNSGTFERDKFVVVPECEIAMAYQLREHLSVSFGLSWMYWSSVVLAGDQVDTNINGRLLVPVPPANPQGPTFRFNDTDFWLGGLNFGVHGTF